MNVEKMKAGVAVIGAGPGGMAAAVAAARQGARVVLVERMGFLGGQLGSGLPFLAFMDMQKRRIVGGLAQQMVDRLAEIGGTDNHLYCPFHLSVTNMNQFYTRIICFEWAKQYGIEVLLHCELSGARVENGKLLSVTVTGKGAPIELEADVFIDATGDGDLGYMAGAGYEKGQEDTGELQPPTLMFNLSGVNFEEFTGYLEKHPEELPYGMGLTHIREGYDAEYFRRNRGYVFFGLKALMKRLHAEGNCPVDRDTVIYIQQPMPGTVAVNTIRILNFDGSDIHDLSRGEMEAHLQILPLIQMLKAHVPGFENAYLTSVNPGIGVRESRRIMGIRKLQHPDAVAGLVPEDAIAIFSYFIDIHSGTGSKTYTQSIHTPYGVPYGCTVSKDVDGLMMAGRCISVDAVTFGSSRIMTLCMAVGEGAGIGAALASKKGISPKEVNPLEVREILKKHGAILCVEDAE
ncbi:MAG: FAD-dependent oxidoreductase [Oscillospiraceae bacterium]